MSQIIFLAPSLFVVKFCDSELILDIPIDFELRMKESRSKTDYSNESLDCSFKDFSPLFRQLSTDELNTRKNYFKNLLYNLINKYHNEFLSKNKIDGQHMHMSINSEQGLTTFRSWNSSFDLNSCPEIPSFDIDSLADRNAAGGGGGKNQNNLGNLIKSHDIKNHLVNEALDKLKTKIDSNSDSDHQIFRDSKNENFLSKYLSNETLEKVSKAFSYFSYFR